MDPLTRFSHAVVLYSVCWEWTPLVVVDGSPHKVQSCSGFIFTVLGVDSTGGGGWTPLTRFSHAVVLYSVCWEWTPLVMVD